MLAASHRRQTNNADFIAHGRIRVLLKFIPCKTPVNRKYGFARFEFIERVIGGDFGGVFADYALIDQSKPEVETVARLSLIKIEATFAIDQIATLAPVRQ